MGLFRNIRRVLGDIAPIVATVAPIVAPGIGGFLASRIAGSIARSTAPRANSAAAVARGAPVVPRFCPRMGVVGRPFSSQFQSRNFSTGGAFAGRPLVFTGGRVPVGREVVAQFCPSVPDPLPVSQATQGGLAPAGAFVVGGTAVGTPFERVSVAQPVLPPPKVAAARVISAPTIGARLTIAQRIAAGI